MEPTFHRRTPQKVITYILRLAKNIHEGRIDLEDVTYVTEEDHRAICSRCDVQKEDVLYIKDGATTGRAAVNDIDEEFLLLSSVGVFLYS